MAADDTQRAIREYGIDVQARRTRVVPHRPFPLDRSTKFFAQRGNVFRPMPLGTLQSAPRFTRFRASAERFEAHRPRTVKISRRLRSHSRLLALLSSCTHILTVRAADELVFPGERLAGISIALETPKREAIQIALNGLSTRCRANARRRQSTGALGRIARCRCLLKDSLTRRLRLGKVESVGSNHRLELVPVVG